MPLPISLTISSTQSTTITDVCAEHIVVYACYVCDGRVIEPTIDQWSPDFPEGMQTSRISLV